MKPRVQLAVSIDTEEDNWRPTRSDVRVENIQRLGEHHRFLRELGLRPTYFVNYAVASDTGASRVIGEIASEGGAEIGAHLHPWHTPPMDEELLPRHSMMKNLPEPLQRAKLERLSAALGQILGHPPTSFRAGRFGLGKQSIQALAATGFEVDSSVTPDVSWVDYDDGPDYTGAPRSCYRIGAGVDPVRPVEAGELIEVPISSGYTRLPFGWRSRFYEHTKYGALRRLPIGRIASASGMVRHVLGGTETESLEDLLALARALINSGAGYLLLVWHSPTLLPGCSPFTDSEEAVKNFTKLIADFVEGVSELATIEPATVSEIAARSGVSERAA